VEEEDEEGEDKTPSAWGLTNFCIGSCCCCSCVCRWISIGCVGFDCADIDCSGVEEGSTAAAAEDVAAMEEAELASEGAEETETDDDEGEAEEEERETATAAAAAAAAEEEDDGDEEVPDAEGGVTFTRLELVPGEAAAIPTAVTSNIPVDGVVGVEGDRDPMMSAFHPVFPLSVVEGLEFETELTS